MNRYSLLEPISFGSLQLKNALIRSATNEDMADPNHSPSEKSILFYEELANYAGLIITGFCFPSKKEMVKQHMIGLISEQQLPAYQRLCTCVHDKGSRILLQIVAGANFKQRHPNDYSYEELQVLKASFLHCAQFALQAGFDGIQLHLAHGYLLSLFLSPKENQRKDVYGNRPLLIVELINELRAALPLSFHISAKMHCSDFDAEGMNMHEALTYAKQFETAGLDSLEISGGNYRKLNKQGFYYYEAQAFADLLDIPVFAVGGNSDPKVMEYQFSHSNLSALSISRAFTNDPAFFHKHQKSGCIRCGHCFSKDVPCIFHQKHQLLFASDFDGTLCHDFQSIDSKDLNAIRLYAKNNLFGLISGREPRSLFKACEKFHIPFDFIIAYGGGIAYDIHGKILFEHLLDTPDDALIAFLKDTAAFFTLYSKTSFWHYQRKKSPLAKRFLQNTLQSYSMAADYHDLQEICVISVFCEDDFEAESLAVQIEQKFPQYQAVANTLSIDISAKGVSKEKALQAVCQHFHIDPQRATAIGDSMNDCSMIRSFNGFAIRGNPQVEAVASDRVDALHEAIALFMKRYN